MNARRTVTSFRKKFTTSNLAGFEELSGQGWWFESDLSHMISI